MNNESPTAPEVLPTMIARGMVKCSERFRLPMRSVSLSASRDYAGCAGLCIFGAGFGMFQVAEYHLREAPPSPWGPS